MKSTGGPAFPNGPGSKLATNGMSLRDYFAAKALPQIIADESAGEHGVGSCLWSEETVAKRAYAVADAMLKAREQ